MESSCAPYVSASASVSSRCASSATRSTSSRLSFKAARLPRAVSAIHRAATSCNPSAQTAYGRYPNSAAIAAPPAEPQQIAPASPTPHPKPRSRAQQIPPPLLPIPRAILSRSQSRPTRPQQAAADESAHQASPQQSLAKPQPTKTSPTHAAQPGAKPAPKFPQ